MQAESDDDDVDQTLAAGRVPAAIITTPLHKLARRPAVNPAEASNLRMTYCIEDVPPHVDVSGARDFVAVQDNWDDMLSQVKDTHSPLFWNFF
jgi:hypothetical protein